MKLLIVDGASLAYRAFYAFRDKPLTNSKGIVTSGPYAFINSLMKMLRELKPTHAVVVFDAKGKTFRHEIFVEYKAQRPKAPPEFALQLSYIKEILDGMNLKRYEIPGVEADDVIATLSKIAESRGFEVFVATLDKDLYQIVSERVRIVDTREGGLRIVGEKEILDKFGVKPSLIPDFLALVGDKIDNIPGVPGIGEKTAAELLNKYGPLERILNLKEESDEIIKKVNAYRDFVIDSLRLNRLRTDVIEEVNFEEMELRPWNKEKLLQVFRELEFYSLMKEIAEEVNPEIITASHIPMGLLGAEFLSVEVVGDNLMFSCGENLVYRVPLEKGISFLSTFRGKIVTFESKKFYKKIENFERNLDFDVLVASFLLDSDKPKFDPDVIFLEWPGVKLAEKRELREAQICDCSAKVYKFLVDQIEKHGLKEVFEKIEIPLQRVLAEMERNGIRIDRKKLEDLNLKMEQMVKELEQRIYEIAGVRFNVNSPKQLAEVLFVKHKLKPIKKTKTGYSTDEESLTKLAEVHPLPAAILEYRQVYKLKSAYVDVFKELIDEKTDRIYPSYNQVGAATGRISCYNPNFQTIPVKSDLGKGIRDMIVAEPGYKILSADYSQVELRILAHFSGDEKLIEIFNKDLDVHTITASYIFGKKPEEISENERRKAKTVNFGIIYGMSPYGLSKELNISVEEANSFIRNFFATYPGVMRWINENLEFAMKNGYVRTLYGRIRKVPQLFSGNSSVIEQGKRIAINTPIQGTAADIIKLSMVEIYNELKRKSLKSRIILQIHDELLLEVKDEEVEEVTKIVKDKMENVSRLKVPLKVEIGVGESWLLASNK
uniref:DNA-directed DNA polymerase n=1 Tax=candidate division WOR-3 bacterium TaxID=2052148 RepID=A0A7V3ZWV0_UNCW3